VVAAVLAAPIVLLTGGGGSDTSSCRSSLRYRGRTYTARNISSERVVEATAIGVGVASGCDRASANVDIRSLAGVTPAVAVAVPADASSVYVRRRLCRRSLPRTLLACLRQSS
jgi:hypothetical protein